MLTLTINLDCGSSRTTLWLAASAWSPGPRALSHQLPSVSRSPFLIGMAPAWFELRSGARALWTNVSISGISESSRGATVD
jgi:hypothetical protein